jgi:hypothetical protein
VIRWDLNSVFPQYHVNIKSYSTHTPNAITQCLSFLSFSRCVWNSSPFKGWNQSLGGRIQAVPKFWNLKQRFLQRSSTRVDNLIPKKEENIPLQHLILLYTIVLKRDKEMFALLLIAFIENRYHIHIECDNLALKRHWIDNLVHIYWAHWYAKKLCSNNERIGERSKNQQMQYNW